MKKILLPLLALVASATVINKVAQADTVALSSLDVSKSLQGWGTPQVNRSVGGHELSIAGQKFASGLGTHASGLLRIDLKGSATRFTANVGVDDETSEGRGSIEFLVYGDGKIIWRSGILRRGQAAKAVDVDVTGLKSLYLRVTDAGDGNDNDHADWADATLTYAGQTPVTVASPTSLATILTPRSKPAPRINGPRLFGVRPGSPF